MVKRFIFRIYNLHDYLKVIKYNQHCMLTILQQMLVYPIDLFIATILHVLCHLSYRDIIENPMTLYGLLYNINIKEHSSFCSAAVQHWKI